nr:hypothetical protein [Lachnospiraceae bacterium]
YMGAPEYLMEFFCKDIKSFFPDFVKEEASNYDTCYMVFCDANPAGILLGNLMDSGRTVNIYVDYALPTYRDCSVGEFLYKELKNTSIKKLIFCGTRTPIHEDYLSKMGFKVTGEGYEKEI